MAKHPMSSFQILEEMWQRHKIGKSATSKRLERLVKNGKICRYLRIQRGAFIYFIPSLHSEDLIQETARNIILECGGTLARVLQAAHAGQVLSVFELGRLTNTRFFSDKKQRSASVSDLISRLEKLGLCLREPYLLYPLVPKSEIDRLIAHYETYISEEAYVLAHTRTLFITKKKAQEMTLYREPSKESLAEHKFDLFGHGGRVNRIRVVVECNLRRIVTPAELESFSQRIGGTIRRSRIRTKSVDRSPIARYYIARHFSDVARVFARRPDKGIRLLDADGILNGSLEEIQPYEVTLRRKPPIYGRYNETKGIAFEAMIEPVYRAQHFKTTRRKPFFLRGSEVIDVDTGNLFTDVDLFAEHQNGNYEILLVECKSGRDNLTRKELFRKMRKYERIADFLQKEDLTRQIKIEVIANVNQIDQEELVHKARFETKCISPAQFHRSHPVTLKGAPKWIFGL
jgi:hypothetical protein